MTTPLPAKIIVFCLPGIGDAILFTPALTVLRRAFPAARIVVITMFQGTADILETNPDLDEVRRFDFFNAAKWDGLRYVWGLRREGFDLSIMPFPSNRREYNVVNWLVGRRWRAGHRYHRHNRRNFYFLHNIRVNEAGTLHNVEENLRLVRAVCDRFGVAVPDSPPHLKLVLTAEDERYATEFLQSRQLAGAPLIGLHTYSSTFKNMHRKCWPKENFVELIRRLGEQYPNARFLIFSGPTDRVVNQFIMQQVDGRVRLVEENNLRRAVAILRRSHVFISNDSGLMHLAAAVDVPVVALFGPTDWRRLHPWVQPHVVVRRDLPCMPCFYYSSRPLRCPAGLDYACMRELNVAEVVAAVTGLLAQRQAVPV